MRFLNYSLFIFGAWFITICALHPKTTLEAGLLGLSVAFVFGPVADYILSNTKRD